MGLLTVLEYSNIEFLEKKSRFIGHIAPAETEDEAINFVNQIRNEYVSATHNCYAWVSGANDRWQRSSDAGEPAGTAGRPILEAIKRSKLHNTVIVVTRYFGGILLGTGGLTRSYSKAASLAIENCQRVERIPGHKIAVYFDYALLGKMDSFFLHNNIEILDKIFGTEVCYICQIDIPTTQYLPTALADLSGGVARLQCLDDSIFITKKV